MSLAPMYGATFPDATVDTMSLPTPTGRARIAGVTSAVPPDPPSPRTAPTSARPTRNRSSATAMAATALPRSPVNTAAAPSGWCAATSAAVTSAPAPEPDVDTSTVTVWAPAARASPAAYDNSAPLVSNVPTT